MLFTLTEALQQIDPHVILGDGRTLRSVEQILFSSDPMDWHEYAICVSDLGQLLIYQIDSNGYVVLPPAFTEEKAANPVHRFYAVTPYSPEYAATA